MTTKSQAKRLKAMRAAADARIAADKAAFEEFKASLPPSKEVDDEADTLPRIPLQPSIFDGYSDLELWDELERRGIIE